MTLAASKQSMPGMSMSITTTAGLCSATAATASSASLAHATTVISGSLSSRLANIDRTMS
jgi:hypothetical protein